ncbi:MAG: BACON domain-containing protein [Candidatus Hydrogenedentes bacterium]|nr:BACON domain-containing protein [Candidatus Hydrogenedentota bacterium]
MREAKDSISSRVSVCAVLLAVAGLALVGCPSICCVLWVYPQSLELDGTQTTATLNVSDLCDSGGTLTWEATPGASWLSVTPSSGTGPGTVEVEVTHPVTKDMSVGRNTSSIRFTSNCGTDVVPVTAWFWPMYTFEEFYDEAPGFGFTKQWVSSWEELYDIEITPDGGYIACGYVEVYEIDEKNLVVDDAYLLKTDIYGERLWAINWGTGGDTSAEALVVTPEGDYVVAGFETLGGEGSGKNGGAQNCYAQLTCVGPDGNIKWSKLYGEPGWAAWDVQLAPDGGFVLAGDNYYAEPDECDAFLIKTDADGNEEWTQVYDTDTDDSVWAMAVTPDNGYVITGETYAESVTKSGRPERHGRAGRREVKGPPVFADVMLLKTDENGTQRWFKTLGGDSNDVGCGVIVVPSECPCGSGADKEGAWQYAVCGHSWSYGEDEKAVYLVLADMMGDEDWHETYVFGDYAAGFDLALTPDGGFIIAGGCELEKGVTCWHDAALLLKVDSDGVEEWAHLFTPDYLHDFWGVRVAPDRGYVAAGYSIWDDYDFECDAYVVKTDEAGEVDE